MQGKPKPLDLDQTDGSVNLFEKITNPFVQSKLPTGAWVYLWVLYLVALIYISIFVPAPYCLDECSFVV